MHLSVESVGGAQAQTNGTSQSPRLEQYDDRSSDRGIFAYVAFSLFSIGLSFERFLDVPRIHTCRLDCKVIAPRRRESTLSRCLAVLAPIIAVLHAEGGQLRL